MRCPHCKDSDPTLIAWTKRTITFGCYKCNKAFEVVRSGENNHLVAEYEKPRLAISRSDYVKNIG